MVYIHSILFVVLVFRIGVEGDPTDDVINTINQGAQTAKTYTFPTDNSAYFNGAGTTIIGGGTFNYIVVGAGSAGAIVAKRLSENSNTVLLLEVGKYENQFSTIPGMWQTNLQSEYNWGYVSKAQQYICQSSATKQCSVPRGKGVGGSSILNGMIYAIGNQHDQVAWPTGTTSSTWADVLPAYIKMQDYTRVGGSPLVHGFNGPVPIDINRDTDLAVRYFLQACDEIDNLNPDYNSGQNLGGTQAVFNKLNGQRASTKTCYLTNINPTYLTIRTESFVYKLIYDSTVTNRVVGVEYVQNKVRYVATATKEVILSAGVYNTPQILQLSGIGPAAELSRIGVSLKMDLPVGSTFYDHLVVNIKLKGYYKKCVSTLEADAWSFLAQRGRLSRSESFALYTFSTDPLITTYPDMEILMNVDESPVTIYNLYNATVLPPLNPDQHGFTMSLFLLSTKSSGRVTLKTNDPKDYPIIDSVTNLDPDDLARLKIGVDKILQLKNTVAFQQIQAEIDYIVPQACTVQYLTLLLNPSPFWVCYIAQMINGGDHGIGTAKMGAVVDNRFKVIGIDGLRVIDGSSMPVRNTGHTQARIMMMAERGSELIIADNP